MNPEQEKEFSDYLLECFKRGVESREMPVPIMGGFEIVEPRVAARCLLTLLPRVQETTVAKNVTLKLLQKLRSKSW